MAKQDNEIIYEYVLSRILLAYDQTRRGKKGATARIEKLGNELVKRKLLTQEQADELLRY